MSEFVKVAKKSDIPDDTGLCVEANGKEIALFKVDGKVHAIYQVCPHAGGPMSEGAIRGKLAMCPWHGWEFDVTTGQCAFNEGIQQPVFAVKEDGEDIYVEA